VVVGVDVPVEVNVVVGVVLGVDVAVVVAVVVALVVGVVMVHSMKAPPLENESTANFIFAASAMHSSNDAGEIM
jgi:hypothetical protein